MVVHVLMGARPVVRTHLARLPKTHLGNPSLKGDIAERPINGLSRTERLARVWFGPCLERRRSTCYGRPGGFHEMTCCSASSRATPLPFLDFSDELFTSTYPVSDRDRVNPGAIRGRPPGRLTFHRADVATRLRRTSQVAFGPHTPAAALKSIGDTGFTVRRLQCVSTTREDSRAVVGNRIVLSRVAGLR